MILVVTPRAARDLDDIHSYIAHDDPSAANDDMRRLVKALKMIAERPAIGRQGATGARRHEWSVPGLPYLIPYRVEAERVIILRVFHTARLRPLDWS